MPKKSSENSGKSDPNFKLLVISFLLFVISLPAFYFGVGTEESGQAWGLLICGFVSLIAGMVISLTVKK